MLRKILGPTVLGLVLLAGVAMPATALAGEITGNGKITPIAFFSVDASLCAFSGLEDGTDKDGDEVMPSGPGATQTPHHEAKNDFEPGVAADRDAFVNCIGRASWQFE